MVIVETPRPRTVNRITPATVTFREAFRDRLPAAAEEPTIPELSRPAGTESVPKEKKIPRFLFKINSVLYAQATAKQLFLLRMDIQKERMRKLEEKNSRKFLHTKEVAQLRAELNQKQSDQEMSVGLSKHHKSRSKGLFTKKGNANSKSKFHDKAGFEFSANPASTERAEGSFNQQVAELTNPQANPEGSRLSDERPSTLRLPESVDPAPPQQTAGIESSVQRIQDSLNQSVRSEKFYRPKEMDSVAEDVQSIQALSSHRDGRALRSSRRKSTGFIKNGHEMKLPPSQSLANLLVVYENQ